MPRVSCVTATNLEIPVSNVNHYQLNYVHVRCKQVLLTFHVNTEMWFPLQY